MLRVLGWQEGDRLKVAAIHRIEPDRIDVEETQRLARGSSFELSAQKADALQGAVALQSA
jgi:hypothetical protein